MPRAKSDEGETQIRAKLAIKTPILSWQYTVYKGGKLIWEYYLPYRIEIRSNIDPQFGPFGRILFATEIDFTNKSPI